jgi:hypothetical protein
MPPVIQNARDTYWNNASSPVTAVAGINTTAGPAPAQNGTFWQGADGNVYVADNNGVNVGGKWDANSQAWWTGNGYTMQNDPNAPRQAAAVPGSTNGGTGKTYKDTTASRNATQVSLDNTGTVLTNALAGADADYKATTDAYDINDAENLTKYNNDVQKNEITRDENTQAGLLAAARGSRGLYATLASLGALGGTGSMLANRAIATEANGDLGAGQKSFDTNVSSLFDARSVIDQQEKQRRLDAKKTWQDTRNNAEYDNIAQNQKLSQEMATQWSDAGNEGEAANWVNKASGYTPQLASKTKKAPTEYAKKSLEYTAPALSKYLGGMNSTAVNVAGGNPINGAIYTSTSPRKDKEPV